jgi:hypothetical protein
LVPGVVSPLVTISTVDEGGRGQRGAGTTAEPSSAEADIREMSGVEAENFWIVKSMTAEWSRRFIREPEAWAQR